MFPSTDQGAGGAFSSLAIAAEKPHCRKNSMASLVSRINPVRGAVVPELYATKPQRGGDVSLVCSLRVSDFQSFFQDTNAMAEAVNVKTLLSHDYKNT